MNLEIQIQSIIVSFVYGMFSSLIYNLSYFLLYNRIYLIKIISNILYVLGINSLFFYILFLINSGVLHIYFVFLFFIGFLIGNYNTKKIRIELKKSK